MKLRSFIAIRIEPTAALRRAVRPLNEMGRPVRAVSPDNLHLTLRFLGDTDPDLFDAIADAMGAAAADAGPFDLGLAGMGVFPDRRRPSVVWVGAREGHPLDGIVRRLNPKLDDLGEFKPARDSWQAHLTLARVKARPPRAFGALLDEHQSTDFGSSRVETIELMTSQLRPAGPVYSVARRVGLSGGGVSP